MRAILMGKHKRSAVSALEHLLRRGVEVVAVVAPPDPEGAADTQRLDRLAQLNGIQVTTDDELYARIERGELADIDLVLSFLFWKRLRAPLIELGRIGCLNFHPAPLPDMRGMGGFNVAILEGFAEWGVSSHFVDADFDTGDLVRVDRFPIEPGATALSLDIDSQLRLLALFKDVVDMAVDDTDLPRTAQGEGRYVSKAEFEAMRRVPPGGGRGDAGAADQGPSGTRPTTVATIEIAGKTVSLVDRALLDEIAAANKEAGRFP